MARPFCPARGDVIWLDFDPQMGHEQAGRRPALVLSHHEYNVKSGLAIVCPMTSRTEKPWPAAR
jgi:mRNA interferase MazF